MKVLMVEKKGKIIEVEYNKFDRLSKERVKEILIESLSMHNNVNIENCDEDIKDIYIAKFPEDMNCKKVIICIREMTPGGRKNLRDEQRIQPESQQINYIFNKINEGFKAILLGAYERDGEIILAAWKVNESNSNNPKTGISKQIKVKTISDAMKVGFAQQNKGKGEFVCAFRKEFLYFYIKNSSWMNNSSIEDLINHVKKEKQENNLCIKLQEKIKKQYNRIVFGAPGTGKSHRINTDIQKYNLNNLFERVTFHPNYTYSQFVGTYKPISKIIFEENCEKEIISYEFVPGPFLRVLISALKDEKNGIPHLLVIEEINRANPAGVFGDIFQLLDRNCDGKSTYTVNMSTEMKKYVNRELETDLNSYIDELYIPSNMYIWATMNSADQGVYPMDSAFKRRWSFEYIGIDTNEEELKGKEYEFIKLKDIDNTYSVYEWNKVRKSINKKLKLDGKINEDKLLGPFFLSKTELLKCKYNQEEFDNIFKSKVLMYLYEDILKYKKLDFFIEGIYTLSDIMNAYDEGKIFNFEIEKI